MIIALYVAAAVIMAVGTHIPGVCDVCSISTVFDIGGVGADASHLRLRGGTAVSRANAEILASKRDSKN